MQVIIHCSSDRQASHLFSHFPLHAEDRLIEQKHLPDSDDIAPYVLRIHLALPALRREQRQMLGGHCSWYEYAGEEDLSLLIPNTLEHIQRLDVFATWLIFQSETLQSTWETVLMDYASQFGGKQQASQWLLQRAYDLPYWVVVLAERIHQTTHHHVLLTKTMLVQMIEELVDTADVS